MADLAGDPNEDQVGEVALRCSAHPGRISAGACPVCGQERCGADAGEFSGACSLCRGAPVVPGGPPGVTVRALAGAALAATPVVLLGSRIASEYVDAKYFSIAVPAVLGVVVGLATEKGAGRGRGLALRLLAVCYALLATAYSFKFVGGGQSPFSPVGSVLPPYAAAAAAAWLWTVPPRQRRSIRPK